MRVAWCPEHRGVMRISFFNPPPARFDSPCPRCQKPLQQEVRGKYEPEVSLELAEIVTKAPQPLCRCCEYFKGMAGYEGYCDWCIDCPVDHCDIPGRFLNAKKEESL